MVISDSSIRVMKLLFLGPPEVLDRIRSKLPGWEVCLANDPEGVDALLPNADAVLDAYMRVGFSRERLEVAGQLSVFVTATTGFDHIDADFLEERSIPLLTLRDQQVFLKYITPAAEHSWLLLMACARRLRGATEHVLDGQWDRNQFPGVFLRGKTLGIIGCGRIGGWMAQYAEAFGMQSIGYDPFVEEWPSNIERSELDPLLTQADFLSIHVPLVDGTRGLLGPDEFARIKPGCILVNTSRGEIIDESSLLAALEEGRILAAGLDVVTGEPDISDHALVEYALKHDNVLITPHIGGYSPDALSVVLDFCCGRILDHFDGEYARTTD